MRVKSRFAPTATLVLILAALLGGAAGCAGEAGGDGAAPAPSGTSASSPATSAATSAATPLPGTPPKTPSDDRGTDRIAGRITEDATGPCYGLITDDGKVYALYSTERLALKKGDTVRVRVAPPRLKISCGAGTQMSALEIEKVS